MNDFIDLILLIARKMLSVYKHKEAYYAEERRLEEKFKSGSCHTARPLPGTV